MKSKRAFTLIELLVVIAIIAILAAILFPVFAQAKAAAKATASLSNMKQIGTGIQMYLSDYDDTYSPRRTVAAQGARTNGDCSNVIAMTSWKQNVFPYVKSAQLYTDPVNPAAKGLDDTSDLAFVTANGRQLAPGVLNVMQLARGYAMADIPFIHKKAWPTEPCFDGVFGPNIIENVANTMLIMETKYRFVDAGPYLTWEQTEYGWSWGGKKWDDKAMVLIFHDSHAKRAAMPAICGRDDEMNMWGYQRNQLATWGAMGDVRWIDEFCTAMPTSIRR